MTGVFSHILKRPLWLQALVPPKQPHIFLGLQTTIQCVCNLSGTKDSSHVGLLQIRLSTIQDILGQEHLYKPVILNCSQHCCYRKFCNTF